MDEQKQHRLRKRITNQLRRDSYPNSLKSMPSLPDFTDGVHQEGVRLLEIFRDQKNFQLWLEALHRGVLPGVSEAREQAKGALSHFRDKARDGMTFADDNPQVAWSKHLRKSMFSTIDSLVDYDITLIGQAQLESWFGTRKQFGRVVRVQFRPPPQQPADYLGLGDEFRFDDEEEFDEIVEDPGELRTVDYITTDQMAVSNLSSDNPHREEIERMVDRFPKHIRNQLTVELGHKVEGQREGVLVLLFHQTAVAVYESPINKEPYRVAVEPAKKPQRKSILSAFKVPLLLLLLTGLAIITMWADNIDNKVRHALLLEAGRGTNSRVNANLRSDSTPKHAFGNGRPEFESGARDISHRSRNEASRARSPVEAGHSDKTIQSMADKEPRITQHITGSQATSFEMPPTSQQETEPSQEVLTIESENFGEELFARSIRPRQLAAHFLACSTENCNPVPTLQAQQYMTALRKHPRLTYSEFEGYVLSISRPMKCGRLLFPQGHYVDLYDSVMALIEPELCYSNLINIHRKLSGEAPAARKRRMSKYQRAFFLYDKCYAEWIHTLNQQSAESERIAKRVKEERKRWVEKNRNS